MDSVEVYGVDIQTSIELNQITVIFPMHIKQIPAMQFYFGLLKSVFKHGLVHKFAVRQLEILATESIVPRLHISEITAL